jgi:hypothetical protein
VLSKEMLKHVRSVKEEELEASDGIYELEDVDLGPDIRDSREYSANRWSWRSKTSLAEHNLHLFPVSFLLIEHPLIDFFKQKT